VSLGLAAPLWLLGLLGLLAPLVLHLLARGRGRRVRVGSVRLLTDSPPRRPRRLQLQRPLLLVLRCLLLAIVALALAAPRLRREAATVTTPRAWLLVEPGVDVDSVEGAREAMAAGAEVRWLASGLPRKGTDDDATALPDVAAVPGGVWSLLREASVTAPAGTRFVVVTRGRLAALRGERPTLANAVEWNAVPDRDADRWVAHAATAKDETARKLRVAVLAAAGRAGDARYVRAALDAAAETAGVLVEMSTEPASLTFWLADAPPPPAVLAALRDGGVLVTDNGAREERCRGTFVTASMRQPVALHRCGASGGSTFARAVATHVPGDGDRTHGPTDPAKPERVRWATDSGRAVLVEQALGRGRWLRFDSRFHPAWSELVLSPAFPEWVCDLLRSGAGSDATAELPSSDRRGDGGQGRPASATAVHRQETSPPRSPAPASPAPERAAWLLLFPLLLAERWLATRR